MTEVAADALGVGRCEGVAGLGQPVLEGGTLSFGRDPAPSSQSTYSLGAPRRPASTASWARGNSQAPMRSSPKRVAQATMALVMTATSRSSSTQS